MRTGPRPLGTRALTQ